jgi:cell wall-associated NlpC family hydrolase
VVLHTPRPDRSRPTDALPHFLKAAARTTTAAVIGVFMSLTAAGTGHAEPSPTEIEVQIDSQWQNLEPVIEQRNKLKGELDVNRTKSQQLAEQLRPVALKVDLALSRVSVISAHYYKGGNASAFNAVLTNGSPTALADQLSLLDRLARTELDEIKDVIALKQQYESQKKPLDVLLAEQTRQEADLASREQSINVEIKRLNDLRLKVYGTTLSTGAVRLAACPYDYTPDPGGKAAKAACSQLGKSYVFGAEGPNTFDCSGITMWAWAQAGAGVRLRHYTQWQYEDTKRITKDQLKPGDLIFYYSDRHHVGIYVGGGYIVHAPHTGDVVRMKRFDGAPISGLGRPVTS